MTGTRRCYLGAARYLAATRNFDGTVHFIFQPGEEGYGGGRVMVQEGLFEKFPCDAVFAMHNKPGIPIGDMAGRPAPMLAASDRFDIHIKARGGHAAHPHLGTDPFVIGAQIVHGLADDRRAQCRPGRFGGDQRSASCAAARPTT